MAGYRTLGSTLRQDYAREELKMRGELRTLIHDVLVALSGDADASMRWTFERYFKFVYLAHGLQLVGWPAEIVWGNLSGITGRARIAHLLGLWHAGALRFERVSAAERAAALLDPRRAAPAPRYVRTPPKLGRSDLKARKPRPKTNPSGKPGRHVRNGPKSAKWVTAAAERRAELAQMAEVAAVAARARISVC
ncbi:uncharacterized protein TRAVEDRAFT_49554 [Trametes versicolor FP-101664 SS1]|uniref:uncharacterized protein n=1 Tax=Trametes versicolor (strain FP-101664) TaxID=717944 RepID=UPI000462315E|nr:uncharacterized protein TRAVEDRAFT_49554 [Trametes versicolor FP-101664 SS1]EIW56736.1 hypothetical protein TRAVEDRAFT_49554 [Trametes versicolor FP-101664 SS1]